MKFSVFFEGGEGGGGRGERSFTQAPACNMGARKEASRES